MKLENETRPDVGALTVKELIEWLHGCPDDSRIRAYSDDGEHEWVWQCDVGFNPVTNEVEISP